ncbi:MAG: hypothetical protein JJ894_04990 [Dinoroseobacter sp.]|nr:hypothetical protein [Dinoroseobacter sp.]
MNAAAHNQSGYRNSAQFSGRALRPEFWVSMGNQLIARTFKPLVAQLLAAALLVFLVFLGGAALASTEDIDLSAFDACVSAQSFAAFPENELLSVGWAESLTVADTDEAWLVDGSIAALSTTQDQPIDWEAANASATDMIQSVRSFVRMGAVKLFTHQPADASLLVLTFPDDGWHIVHCIYGGPMSPQMEELAETIKSMDGQAGITQATPELSILNIRSKTETNGEPSKTRAMEAQLGIFLASELPLLGRAPRVELGMSIYSYTQK